MVMLAHQLTEQWPYKKWAAFSLFLRREHTVLTALPVEWIYDYEALNNNELYASQLEDYFNEIRASGRRHGVKEIEDQLSDWVDLYKAKKRKEAREADRTALKILDRSD